MDIKISTKQPANNHKTKWVIAVVLTVAFLSVWSFTQPSAAERVASSQIWTDAVKVGNLALEVEGYGKLKSTHQRLLTAPANATVEEILLKPGALVTKDSVIARLSNPIISQQIKDAERSFNNAKAKYLQLELKQKRELLAHKAMQEQLMSELELAELKMLAEKKLMSKGIVSDLTFKRSQLNFRQLSRRIAIEKTRLIQLSEVYQQELAIEQGKIEQQKEDVAVINEQFDRLTVRAGIDGVVQNLVVELGQSVALGEQVALVGSVDNLFALLSVSQSDIELIALEQLVQIDTRGGTVSGKVQRINPMVKQGMITIEVLLLSELPKNARPDLNVDGVISTGKLTAVKYIKKPINASKGMKAQLFRLDKQQNQAEKIHVNYGQESGEYIQILTGALEHDILILSDMSRWNNAEQITITQ